MIDATGKTPADIAEGLRGLTIPQVSRELQDLAARAKHAPAETGEHKQQLDFQARLVTELRQRKIWPDRKD